MSHLFRFLTVAVSTAPTVGFLYLFFRIATSPNRSVLAGEPNDYVLLTEILALIGLLVSQLVVAAQFLSTAWDTYMLKLLRKDRSGARIRFYLFTILPTVLAVVVVLVMLIVGWR